MVSIRLFSTCHRIPNRTSRASAMDSRILRNRILFLISFYYANLILLVFSVCSLAYSTLFVNISQKFNEGFSYESNWSGLPEYPTPRHKPSHVRMSADVRGFSGITKPSVLLGGGAPPPGWRAEVPGPFPTPRSHPFSAPHRWLWCRGAMALQSCRGPRFPPLEAHRS